MARLTLEDIFAEPDEFGLLAVNPKAPGARRNDDSGVACLRETAAFLSMHGPPAETPNSLDHEEMRLRRDLGENVRPRRQSSMRQEDRLGSAGRTGACPRNIMARRTRRGRCSRESGRFVRR